MRDASRFSCVRDYRVQSHNGYRALHLIVRADDGKPVELQLPTRAQHAWANLTERFPSILDPDLNYDDGSAQERSLLDQFSFWGHHVDLSQHRFSVARLYAGADKEMQRVKADTVAAPDAIELPRHRRGDELMMEVERFVQLCKSLYPSGGMEL